jgi:hypothetical protein
MGRDPRRKGRPKRPQQELTPRQRFQFAMIENAMEDNRDHGGECLLCRTKTRNSNVWMVNVGPLSEWFGAAPGKHRTFVYPLCNPCIEKARKTCEDETRIIERHRSELAAAEAGLVIEVIDGMRVIPFEDPGDAVRFQAAWLRNAPPPGTHNCPKDWN